MTKTIDEVYRERAIAGVLFAKMAIRNGYEAGTGLDDGWAVLYVQLPEGQVSWHFAETDLDLLEGLPEFAGKWDGTSNGRDTKFVVSINEEKDFHKKALEAFENVYYDTLCTYDHKLPREIAKRFELVKANMLASRELSKVEKKA